MKFSRWVGATVLALVAACGDVPASAMAKKKETVDVCKHGCDYRTIQDAVDDTGKKAVINVHPGTYREGVRGLRAPARRADDPGDRSKNAKKVVLEGKQRQGSRRPAGQQRDRGRPRSTTLRVINLTGPATTSPTGSSFIDCDGYLMKNLRASFNRAYGLFAFNCIGGRMTKSVGWGQGDSAYYVGETPAQNKPKWTKLDHLDGHENVLGYSGTNSKYVKITKSNFYNNGVGVVPNTLDSERFEPTATGIIEKNNIFWNNFNYFLPNSRVKTVSNGLGRSRGPDDQVPDRRRASCCSEPTAGSSANNKIFGNFKVGRWAISDPFNEGDNAISRNNQFVNNADGPQRHRHERASTSSTTAAGSGNCFAGNVSSTFDPSATPRPPSLYPTCPAPPPPASGHRHQRRRRRPVRRAGRLRGHAPAREPGVLVDQAPAPAVQEVQAARPSRRGRRAREAPGADRLRPGRDRRLGGRGAGVERRRRRQSGRPTKVTVADDYFAPTDAEDQEGRRR